jgi:hypothetical protein
MGQIAKTNFKIINSNRPTQLIGTTEPGVLLDIDNVESGGKVVPPYNPAHNYPIILKRCHELSPALTAATQSTGNYVCTTIPVSQGGFGNGCYDSGLFNLPCVPYYAGGNCFPDIATCYSVCPQNVTNPGGNDTLNRDEVAKRLKENIANKLLDENPEEEFGQGESAFASAFMGAPPPGPNDCVIYNGDIWIDRFWDEQTNTFVTVPDCYPNIPNRVGMGCPSQPGQCFFWNDPGIPVCVVERVLGETASYTGARDGFICETCLQPTCLGGPGCSPNGTASQGGYPNPNIPTPYQVLINPTGAFCTDCNPVNNSSWYFCLHNTDPIWTPTNSCIQLPANTIVNVVYNPFPGPTPTIEYYATNGPNTYRLSSNIYQNTLVACELNCVGGCKTEVSGGTVACNYNVNAVYDDGSCCFSQPCIGCGDPTAINYAPTSCSFNNLLCLYPGQGCIDNSVGSSTDINGNATCGANANQLCQYCNYDPIASIPTSCCDTVGCMNNSPGNNPDVNGMYTCGPLANQGCLSFNYDPNACCPGYCCNQMGCTDPTASNYDPLACIDDNSCEWIFYGCTDNTACNYDPNATNPCFSQGTPNGCCEYPSCKDQYATNYNPSGQLDCNCVLGGQDYSCCIYTFGCLDPNAYNYSSTVSGCDNGNGIADPTNFSCCLYPTWNCNPNLDIEGPGGSGTDIWEYCVLQDNQNGYATKEECWCACGDDCVHPVNCDCCDRKVKPTASFPLSLTTPTAPCCVEYLLWDINLQAFRFKGANDYCITGDMKYLFGKKFGDATNLGCQGYHTNAPVPFEVGWVNGRGIKYGEEVILKPTAMFGNTDPVGAYFFMVTCKNIDYLVAQPSMSQICIDYIPGTQTLKQSYSINNNGLPGLGFGTPNTSCDCDIKPCEVDGYQVCSSPDCHLPGSVPNYPGITEIKCCIKNFGITIPYAPGSPIAFGIMSNLGYIGHSIGVSICQEYTNAYTEIWKRGSNSGNWQLVMTSGPSYNLSNYSFNIVTPGNYVEYKVFLDCSNANCYQNRAGTAPNPTPPIGVCGERKICLQRVDNTNDWQIIPCGGGPIIVGPIDDVLTSDG